VKLPLLLLLPLLLVACPPCPLTIPALPPGQLGETPILTGKAENWIGRVLTIKAEIQKGRGASKVIDYLGNGTIDAAGNFSILMPGLMQMQPYLETSGDPAFYDPANCVRISITPPDVKSSYAVYLSVFDGTNRIGQLTLEPSRFTVVGDEFAALLFFDKNSIFNVTCTFDGSTNHLDARFGLGWNIDLNELYAPNNSHETVGALPASIKWTYSILPVPALQRRKP
jgi:hypothetical protein